VGNLPTINGGVSAESDQIEVFSPDQTGNATPARTISGPQSQLTQISGLGVDGAGNIYVEMSTVGTAADPTILEFAGGANGTVSTAPINRISGTQTMFSSFLLDSLTVDGPGNIYVLTYTFPYTGPGTEPFYMLRFAAGATGNAVPTAALLSVSGVGIAAH
jgi:serine/threonine protein kinase, bacterial